MGDGDAVQGFRQHADFPQRPLDGLARHAGVNEDAGFPGADEQRVAAASAEQRTECKPHSASFLPLCLSYGNIIIAARLNGKQ